MTMPNSKAHSSPAAKSHKHNSHGERRWWQWTKTLAKYAFFAAVAYLLFTQARTVQWEEVIAAIRRHPPGGLLAAAVLAICSFATYSCFDLLGRAYTGHRLPVRKVLTVSFVSYAFNLNMGALVGGVAFRYRLYSRLGLDAGVITRVLGMSMLTNWLGYALVAGLVFWWAPISLPPGWKVDELALRSIGFVMVAAAAAYLLLCAIKGGHTWTIRKQELTLPSLRFGALQLGMSSLNWLIMACIMFLLLEQRLPFPQVVAVLTIGAIAGVITHIPAGLGVLETVFVALLSHQLPKSELLAAVLMYRAIYYIAPLIIATVTYLLFEASLKRNPAAA